MYKAIFLFICLTAGTHSACCQTFNKWFIVDSVATQSYSVVTTDSFIFVAGECVDTTVNGVKSFLAKFDLEGNFISRSEIRPSLYLQFDCPLSNTMIKTSDGGFAVVGQALDFFNNTYVALIKYTPTGEIQFYQTYNVHHGNLYEDGFAVLELNQEYYIVGDVQFPGTYIDNPFLIKTDLLGNLITSNIYTNFPLRLGLTGSLCKKNDSTLIICNGRRDVVSSDWETSFITCFLTVDTSGILRDQHCTSDTNTSACFGIATTRDGNFISTGNYYAFRRPINGLELCKYLAKWDTAFNKIWDLKNGDLSGVNGFTDFLQDSQGNIIVCGQNLNDTIAAEQFAGVIAKIDANGHLLWQRKYMLPTGLDPDYSSQYLYDINLMQNGDIIAVGYWESVSTNSPFNFLQVGWMLRIDSNGCIDNENCGIADIADRPQQTISSEQNPIQIFPNPSSGIFTVNIQMQLPAASVIEIYDAFGNKLLRQPVFYRSNLLNLYGLSNGIYFYKISYGLGSVEGGKLVIQK